MDEPDGGWEPLIRSAGRGDALAQDRLVRVLSPYVGRICGAVALQHGDDAAQETFLAILRGVSGVRHPAAFPGWVRRVAVRESIRVAQRAAKVVPIDPEAAGFPDAADLPDPATVLDVRATLAALSPAHRAILVLRDLEGWSEDQVAAVLDIAPGTAKSRLHRARTAFSKRWTA